MEDLLDYLLCEITHSLLADIFCSFVFAGIMNMGKGTFALDQNSLLNLYNHHPRPWTGLFKMHVP